MKNSKWHPETSPREILTFLINELHSIDPDTYFYFTYNDLSLQLNSHISYDGLELACASPDCNILYYTCKYSPALYEILTNLFSILHYSKGIPLWDDQEIWGIEWLEEKLFDPEGSELEEKDVLRMKKCIKHFNTSANYHIERVRSANGSIQYYSMLLRQYHPRLEESMRIKELLLDALPLLNSNHSFDHFLAYRKDEDEDDCGHLLEPTEYFKLYWDKSDDISAEVYEYHDCQSNGIGWYDPTYEWTFNSPSDLLHDYTPAWPLLLVQFFRKLDTAFDHLKSHHHDK